MKRKRRRDQGSALAEFPVALAIFIPVVLALISLFSFALAIATVQITCELAVRKAAQTITIDQAKQEVSKYDHQILTKFFSPLITRQNTDTPVLELVIDKSRSAPNQVISSSNSKPVMYCVSAKYFLRPFLFPKSLSMHTDAFAIAEHPEAL